MRHAWNSQNHGEEFVAHLLGIVPNFRSELPGLVLELADPLNANLRQYAEKKKKGHTLKDRIERVRPIFLRS